MAGDYDWARADAWRQHPLLRRPKLRHIFPGFYLGVGLFTVYVAATTGASLVGGAAKKEGAKEEAHH